MASKIEKFLTEGARLHRLLNSSQCPDDINEKHEALFAERKPLLDGTDRLLAADGFEISMHDAYITGFSERRAGLGWRSTFHSNAFAYELSKDGEYEELGYCRLDFEVDTKKPLRAMAGREIYSFLIDEETKQLGASFHQPGKNMGVVVVDYTGLSIAKGPLESWDELRRKRQASVPSVNATLQIERDEGLDEIPAKWYSDGSITVLRDEEWISYSDFSGRKYADEIPGVKRIFIEVDEGGARSEVGVNSDEHGPSYANVQPLKSLLRRKSVEAGMKRRKP